MSLGTGGEVGVEVGSAGEVGVKERTTKGVVAVSLEGTAVVALGGMFEYYQAAPRPPQTTSPKINKAAIRMMGLTFTAF